MNKHSNTQAVRFTEFGLPWLLGPATGAALGALAWVVLPWATGLCIAFAFLVGVCTQRRQAFGFAWAYYLGALCFVPVAAWEQQRGLGNTSVMLTAWVLGSAAAAGLWALAVDRKGRATHTAARLVLVWFIALATPLGLMGVAHPLWGWSFAGDGFMGVFTLVVAPVMTAGLAFAIRSERDRGGQGAGWSWKSPRSLSVLLCVILVAKGVGDHTAVPKQAARAAALHSHWGQLGATAALSLEQRLQRVQSAASQFAASGGQPAIADLLITGVGAFGVKSRAEAEAFARDVADKHTLGAIPVGLGLSVRNDAQGGSAGGSREAVPALALARNDQEPMLFCAHGWRKQVFGWNGVSPGQVCAGGEHLFTYGGPLEPQRTMRMLLGDEVLLAGLQLGRQLVRPADAMLLATSSAGPGEALGQRMQAKHFKAMAMLLKTPHLMAVNRVNQVD
ncbi:hypothetical protein [Hydrogenophaga laconesensis]|uniref:Uncharacterized protein n=1 Tax=Hydrogenophaga laconesensis TaxID=1805971 RepID=A0ABU1VJD0_9BURK|nr:hypothetical protein [Hydrogenophaga laconesensis]MDR7097584.1 hypothetical protein [Hydrogenophaga laconesensis]